MGRSQSRVTRRSSAAPSRWRQLALLPDIVLALVAFALPVAIMVSYSFGKGSPYTFEVDVDGRLDSYRRLFGDTYRSAIVRSLQLSGIAIIGTAIVGFLVARCLVQLQGRMKVIALGLITFPSVVSFVVRINALGNVMGPSGPIAKATDAVFGTPTVLLATWRGVVVGTVLAYLPLMVLPVYSALERLDVRLVDAAHDLGAGWFRTIRTVELSAAAPGLTVGAFLVGTLALGEYLVPRVIGGGKTLQLGNILAEQATGSNRPFGAAVATTMLAIVALAGLVTALILRRMKAA
jgi:ABC-type spermidine/putrescine transport system permease subunit I